MEGFLLILSLEYFLLLVNIFYIYVLNVFNMGVMTIHICKKHYNCLQAHYIEHKHIYKHQSY